MKLFELRKQIKQEFVNLNIEPEDADFIVSEVLKVNRCELALVEDVSEKDYNRICECAKKRKQNIPIDMIFKKAYFYGLQFKVNKNVLTPRSDSEVLVETALKYINKNGYKTVIDLCTGSGCLAISIKKNANVEITASDISKSALEVAQYNANKNDVVIKFVESNMFENINETFDFIVSNPPYIATEVIKELEEIVTKNDPHIALDGGELGLKFYNIIHDNAKKHLNANGMIALEIGDEQKLLVESLFTDFVLVEEIKDLSGNDRVLVFKK